MPVVVGRLDARSADLLQVDESLDQQLVALVRVGRIAEALAPLASPRSWHRRGIASCSRRSAPRWGLGIRRCRHPMRRCARPHQPAERLQHHRRARSIHPRQRSRPWLRCRPPASASAGGSARASRSARPGAAGTRAPARARRASATRRCSARVGGTARARSAARSTAPTLAGGSARAGRASTTRRGFARARRASATGRVSARAHRGSPTRGGRGRARRAARPGATGAVVPAEPGVPPVLAGVFPAVSQTVRRKNPIASLGSFIRLLRACSSVSYPLGSREFSTANHKP